MKKAVIALCLIVFSASSPAETNRTPHNEIVSWDCSHCRFHGICYRKRLSFEDFGVDRSGNVKKRDGGVFYQTYSGLRVSLTTKAIQEIRRYFDLEKNYTDEYFRTLTLVSFWERWAHDTELQREYDPYEYMHTGQTRYIIAEIKFPDGKTGFYNLEDLQTQEHP